MAALRRRTRMTGFLRRESLRGREANDGLAYCAAAFSRRTVELPGVDFVLAGALGDAAGLGGLVLAGCVCESLVEEVAVAFKRDEGVGVAGDCLDEFDVGAGGDEAA